MNIGPTELLLILFIVMLLFGVGRISKVGSELGSAVANFRKGLNDGKDNNNANANAKDQEIGFK